MFHFFFLMRKLFFLIETLSLIQSHIYFWPIDMPLLFPLADEIFVLLDGFAKFSLNMYIFFG